MTDREDPHNPWRNPASAGGESGGTDGGASGATGPTAGYPQPGYPSGYPTGGYPAPGQSQAGFPQPGYPQGGYQQPGYQQPGYQQGGYQYDYGQPGNPTSQYTSAYGAPGWQPEPGGGGSDGGGPKRSGGKLALMIGAAVVVVLLVLGGAVFGIAKLLGNDDTATVAAPSTSAAAPPTSGSSGATGVDSCGYPGTGESAPITENVVAGPLSFPVSAAPGWSAQTYTTYAQSSRAAGIIKSITGQPWQAGIEIGLTAFPSKISGDEAVKRMVSCIVAGQGYKNTNPTVKNQTDPQQVTVDGVKAWRITADILVSKSDVTVPGDHLTVIVIDSAPQSYFLADTPIGDDALAAVAKDVESKLKVAKDV